jgi:hypothetical protein
VPNVTKINSGALPVVQWRPRPGAFSPRSSFLGTGALGVGYGTQPCAAVVLPVPRVRNQAALAIPAMQLGQTNNYNHMTSVYAFGEGASGPPPYRDPA